MKIKIVTGILVLAVIALVSGATILAMAEPGTQENPFITLNYLNNNFRPQIMAEVRNMEDELKRVFNERITELEAQIDAGQGSQATSPGSADKFSVVTLSRGQSLTCSVGTEIMLRVGTATGQGSAPVLVNYTTGETLAAGAELSTNHMYLVTIEGNGIRATADTVRVLVRGEYSIG